MYSLIFNLTKYQSISSFPGRSVHEIANCGSTRDFLALAACELRFFFVSSQH